MVIRRFAKEFGIKQHNTKLDNNGESKIIYYTIKDYKPVYIRKDSE